MASYLTLLDATPEEQRWPRVRQWMREAPLPLYRELRRRRPVLCLPEAVLATRHADCTEILRRTDLFSVAPYRAKQGAYWMAQDDTAEHWREKSIMRAILDFEDIPGIRRYVAERSSALLGVAAGTLDAVDGFSRAVPIALVQDWFGFADSDPAALRTWSYWNQMDAFWNQPFDAGSTPDQAGIVARREAANLEMRAYLVGLVQRRAAALRAGAGGTDPVSRLLRLSASGGLRFPVERVVLNVGGLLIGAVETTSHAVVNALDVLLRSPDRLARARDAAASGDDATLDGCVFEALRFRPPFPYFFRTVEREASLARGTRHEVQLAPGTTVLAVTHSAMFDAAAFEDPDSFDPGRSRTNAFHFGQGLHECLGRAVGGVMIPEMVRHALLLPGLEVGPVDRRGGPVPEAWSWRWSATR